MRVTQKVIDNTGEEEEEEEGEGCLGTLLEVPFSSKYPGVILGPLHHHSSTASYKVQHDK